MNVRSRNQVFAPGELPLVILGLAERGPFTAYELLADLGRLFGPGYRPSPGSAYPAITALQQERLLAVAQDGRAKRYSLTASGRKVLEQRRSQLAAIENRTGTRLTGDDGLKPVLDRFVDRVMQHEGLLDVSLVERVLESAEHELINHRRSAHG